MDISTIVGIFAPDHLWHRLDHMPLDVPGPDVHVMCPCGVRLTFLATEIAKLEPTAKAEIAFQVGSRSSVSAPSVEPSVRKGKVGDGS